MSPRQQRKVKKAYNSLRGFDGNDDDDSSTVRPATTKKGQTGRKGQSATVGTKEGQTGRKGQPAIVGTKEGQTGRKGQSATKKGQTGRKGQPATVGTKKGQTGRKGQPATVGTKEGQTGRMRMVHTYALVDIEKFTMDDGTGLENERVRFITKGVGTIHEGTSSYAPPHSGENVSTVLKRITCTGNRPETVAKCFARKWWFMTDRDVYKNRENINQFYTPRVDDNVRFRVFTTETDRDGRQKTTIQNGTVVPRSGTQAPRHCNIRYTPIAGGDPVTESFPYGDIFPTIGCRMKFVRITQSYTTRKQVQRGRLFAFEVTRAHIPNRTLWVSRSRFGGRDPSFEFGSGGEDEDEDEDEGEGEDEDEDEDEDEGEGEGEGEGEDEEESVRSSGPHDNGDDDDGSERPARRDSRMDYRLVAKSLFRPFTIVRLDDNDSPKGQPDVVYAWSQCDAFRRWKNHGGVRLTDNVYIGETRATYGLQQQGDGIKWNRVIADSAYDEQQMDHPYYDWRNPGDRRGKHCIKRRVTLGPAHGQHQTITVYTGFEDEDLAKAKMQSFLKKARDTLKLFTTAMERMTGLTKQRVLKKLLWSPFVAVTIMHSMRDNVNKPVRGIIKKCLYDTYHEHNRKILDKLSDEVNGNVPIDVLLGQLWPAEWNANILVVVSTDEITDPSSACESGREQAYEAHRSYNERASIPSTYVQDTKTVLEWIGETGEKLNDETAVSVRKVTRGNARGGTTKFNVTVQFYTTRETLVYKTHGSSNLKEDLRIALRNAGAQLESYRKHLLRRDAEYRRTHSYSLRREKQDGKYTNNYVIYLKKRIQREKVLGTFDTKEEADEFVQEITQAQKAHITPCAVDMDNVYRHAVVTSEMCRLLHCLEHVEIEDTAVKYRVSNSLKKVTITNLLTMRNWAMVKYTDTDVFPFYMLGLLLREQRDFLQDGDSVTFEMGDGPYRNQVGLAVTLGINNFEPDRIRYFCFQNNAWVPVKYDEAGVNFSHKYLVTGNGDPSEQQQIARQSELAHLEHGVDPRVVERSGPIMRQAARVAAAAAREEEDHSKRPRAGGQAPPECVTNHLTPTGTDKTSFTAVEGTDAEDTEEFVRVNSNPITYQTAKRLTGQYDSGWLNDEIINAYTSLITNKYEDVYCFGTHFMHTLQNKTGGLDQRGVKNHTKIQTGARITARHNIFKKRAVFFPVNRGDNHWSVYVARPAEKTVTYYDSFRNFTMHREYINKLKAYLKQEADSVHKSAVNWKWTFKDAGANVPKQDNGNDCGVFMLANIELLAGCRNLDLNKNTYDSRMITDFRKTILGRLQRQSIGDVDTRAGMGGSATETPAATRARPGHASTSGPRQLGAGAGAGAEEDSVMLNQRAKELKELKAKLGSLKKHAEAWKVSRDIITGSAGGGGGRSEREEIESHIRALEEAIKEKRAERNPAQSASPEPPTNLKVVYKIFTGEQTEDKIRRRFQRAVPVAVMSKYENAVEGDLTDLKVETRAGHRWISACRGKIPAESYEARLKLYEDRGGFVVQITGDDDVVLAFLMVGFEQTRSQKKKAIKERTEGEWVLDIVCNRSKKTLPGAGTMLIEVAKEFARQMHTHMTLESVISCVPEHVTWENEARGQMKSCTKWLHTYYEGLGFESKAVVSVGERHIPTEHRYWDEQRYGEHRWYTHNDLLTLKNKQNYLLRMVYTPAEDMPNAAAVFDEEPEKEKEKEEPTVREPTTLKNAEVRLYANSTEATMTHIRDAVLSKFPQVKSVQPTDLEDLEHTSGNKHGARYIHICGNRVSYNFYKELVKSIAGDNDHGGFVLQLLDEEEREKTIGKNRKVQKVKENVTVVVGLLVVNWVKDETSDFPTRQAGEWVLQIVCNKQEGTNPNFAGVGRTFVEIAKKFADGVREPLVLESLLSRNKKKRYLHQYYETLQFTAEAFVETNRIGNAVVPNRRRHWSPTQKLEQMTEDNEISLTEFQEPLYFLRMFYVPRSFQGEQGEYRPYSADPVPRRVPLKIDIDEVTQNMRFEYTVSIHNGHSRNKQILDALNGTFPRNPTFTGLPSLIPEWVKPGPGVATKVNICGIERNYGQWWTLQEEFREDRTGKIEKSRGFVVVGQKPFDSYDREPTTFIGVVKLDSDLTTWVIDEKFTCKEGKPRQLLDEVVRRLNDPDEEEDAPAAGAGAGEGGSV